MGAKSAKTIILRGMLNGMTFHILVENANSHDFINCNTLQRVGLTAIEIDHGLEGRSGQWTPYDQQILLLECKD